MLQSPQLPVAFIIMMGKSTRINSDWFTGRLILQAELNLHVVSNRFLVLFSFLQSIQNCKLQNRTQLELSIFFGHGVYREKPVGCRLDSSSTRTSSLLALLLLGGAGKSETLYKHIYLHDHISSTKFFMPITYWHGFVLFFQYCAKLCTSGFVYDVIFVAQATQL